ncbi:MAG TPA: potassium transporter TrkG [Paracoccaceae bacterium]|nr:potassium transporter TrkG [Paracoccaceae bacterium]
MRVAGVPVFLWFAASLGLAMWLPAGFGLLERDWRSARLFLFAGAFTLFAAAVLGVAARRAAAPGRGGREELLTLVGVFAGGPVFAATPILLLRPDLGPFAAWFEAAASLSTTGATLLDAAPRALHLWRGLLGWIGGFATLVAVVAVLAPRELTDLPGAPPARESAARVGRALALGPGGRRTVRAAGTLLPVYLAFTAFLVVALEALGMPAFEALMLAMGVVSTSGIGPGTTELAMGGEAGRGVEWLLLLALLVAANRRHHAWRRGSAGIAAGDVAGTRRRAVGLAALAADPELRLTAFALAAAVAWLWGPGALAAPEGLAGIEAGLVALSGTLVTAVSFLTTTGYGSADWGAALAWSGLGPGSAGPLLAGLATLGGGVATTAGGVKLYRAYALYRHGIAELARLPHPHLVDSARTMGGSIRRNAVVNAWVASMLYLAALGATTLALGAAGLPLDGALVAAAAALANCGPLLPEAVGTAWADLPPPALAFAATAMILGRVELVAAVALLNPGWWGR